MGASVSRLMERRCAAHSSFCSRRMAPTRRVTAASLGKMPTTSVRRLISPFTRSIGLVTGMQIPVPVLSGWGGLRVLAYGATIRDEGHREHAEWAGAPRCWRPPAP